VDLADRGAGINATPQEHATSVEERLPCRLAENLVVTLKADIEAPMTASSATINCW
jgi:hypothetical protein